MVATSELVWKNMYLSELVLQATIACQLMESRARVLLAIPAQERLGSNKQTERGYARCSRKKGYWNN